ncbi:MAG: dihydropteroate synthase [Chitinophagales bacterium]|nr:dihydropteroate synthase [Chitinophagales bacterium]
MTAKNTVFSKNTLLNCGGTIIDVARPKVMGILNATPDSFYDGGSYLTTYNALRRAEQLLKEGATFIDIGGMSTRPGAEMVSEVEELQRVLPIVEAIKRQFPEAILSIDTVRGKVAQEAVAIGVGMVNDVSAGTMDAQLWEILPRLKVPYVLMHMQGTPQTMQATPSYEIVRLEVLDFLVAKTNQLKQLGVQDIVVDPGFGFGKTVEHNFQLLNDLSDFGVIGRPVMVGLSRKSMICKVLKKDPKDALNGTTALHAIALLKGANILRVHDVNEAIEVAKLVGEMEDSVD